MISIINNRTQAINSIFMLWLNYHIFTDLFELLANEIMNSPRIAWLITASAYSIEFAMILSKQLNNKCKHLAWLFGNREHSRIWPSIPFLTNYLAYAIFLEFDIEERIFAPSILFKGFPSIVSTYKETEIIF